MTGRDPGASRPFAIVAAAVVAVIAMGITLLWMAGSSDGRDPAAMFACGEDVALSREIPLRVETVFLAADGRRYAPCAGEHPPDHLAMREQDVLDRALASEDPVLIRAAVIGLGRMGPPPEVPPADYVGELVPWLEHGDAGVRRAAAQALADSLDGVVREPISREWLVAAGNDGTAVQARQAGGAVARAAIERRIESEDEPEVTAALLEALGRLPNTGDAERDEIETFLAARLSSQDPTVRLGAARAVETLVRRNPRRPVLADSIAVLRQLVASGSEEARIRRLARLTLNSARDNDADTIALALADDDWQVRRLGIARLSYDVRAQAPLLDAALADPEYQVRLEALRIVARAVAETKRCAPILTALGDPDLPVVLAALDQVPSGCREEDDVLAQIEGMVSLLEPARDYWHVPARAFAALARLAPERAGTLLPGAVAHPVWQVRAVAAEVAGRLEDGEAAAVLAADDHPNVRTVAVRILAASQHPDWLDAALEGLRSTDFDLIRVSAGVIGQATGPERTRAIEGLLSRLDTLTAQASDTSRDPRLAIIRQLADLMERADAPALAEYIKDFDPRVGFAARDAYLELTGANDVPLTSEGTRARYPYQPAVETLASLPRSVTMRFDDGGVVEVELLVDDAPVAVARFIELVRAGYYDGLTFHRVVPNFVIQGGSPGANEYVGADRYLRDALGAPNDRGTFGLSTRGRDTGDGQFYVNMIDNPRLDHTYTVFGRVTTGMDVLDRVLPGARIESIR